MFTLALGDNAFLQKVEMRHAEEFLRVTTPIREDIGRYFAVRESADGFRDWIGEYRDLDAQDAGLACGIWRGSELVGMICILEISRHYLSCSFACWMVPDARGRGLAARATRALTTYAFEALQLERVVIRVATENHVSQRIPERLGFRFEGVARSAEVIREQFLDVAIYAMLAGEWADACARADCYAARPVRPEDAEWMSDLAPMAFDSGHETAEVLAVEPLALVGISSDGWLTRLETVPAHRGALRTLFDRLEGDLRRRGIPLLRAELSKDAPTEDADALAALGFFSMGVRSYGRVVGNLSPNLFG